jgi:RNA polymerase sigma-70 factor (ECF subfamily)
MPQMHTEASDDTLLAAMADGSRDAVATLYDRYSGMVYGLVRRMVRQPEACEEVVQDVFVNAWRHAGTYDAARAKPSTWLMTIAHNCAIDHLRREQSRPMHDSVELLEHDGSRRDVEDAAQLDPAEGVSARDRAATLRAVVAQIPPLQREAIELAFFSGLTHVEVAARLGEPVGTIKTRIFHGMRRLRELLDAAGVRDDTGRLD